MGTRAATSFQSFPVSFQILQALPQIQSTQASHTKRFSPISLLLAFCKQDNLQDAPHQTNKAGLLPSTAKHGSGPGRLSWLCCPRLGAAGAAPRAGCLPLPGCKHSSDPIHEPGTCKALDSGTESWQKLQEGCDMQGLEQDCVAFHCRLPQLGWRSVSMCSVINPYRSQYLGIYSITIITEPPKAPNPEQRPRDGLSRKYGFSMLVVMTLAVRWSSCLHRCQEIEAGQAIR